MSENQPAGQDWVGVSVDTDLCIGVGQCEMYDPDIFAVGDDAVAQVMGAGQLTRDRAEAAVERCPAQAISIVEN